jgi:transcriptional regulator with XRE-family HTH domain
MSDKLRDPVWLAFRATVKRRLGELDLKQYELAQRVGVNPSSIVGWLKEGSLPRGQMLMRLARVLNFTPDDLVPTSLRAAPERGEAATAYRTGGRVVLDEIEVLLNDLRARWEKQGGLAQSLEESSAMLSEAEAAQVRKVRRRTKGS